jgi:hypothetical protein
MVDVGLVFGVDHLFTHLEPNRLVGEAKTGSSSKACIGNI